MCGSGGLSVISSYWFLSINLIALPEVSFYKILYEEASVLDVLIRTWESNIFNDFVLFAAIVIRLDFKLPPSVSTLGVGVKPRKSF